MDAIKVREDRLRRKLISSGHRLRKTPARSSLREVHGIGYMIVDNERNYVVYGYSPMEFAGTLEGAEDYAVYLAA